MTQPKSFLFNALATIITDASHRGYMALGVIASLPVVVGVPTPVPGYPHLDSPDPNYYDFTLESSTNPTVLADSIYFGPGNLQLQQWAARAQKIRHNTNQAYCAGNLSMALEGAGAAYQASASGSTTLLTLLPTVGALVGPPAKELWVLYKLVPLAGFLSSVLALGGSIVPNQVSEYASLEDFSYNGMLSANAIDGMMKRRPSGRTWSDQSDVDPQQVANHFADQVYARAMDSRGSAKTWKVALGIFGLVACILLICSACAILSYVSIVVWWCRADGWAFTWYSITIFSSVLENYANAPFAKEWVMRISRAPQLRIASDAPWVIAPDQSTIESSSEPLYDPGASKTHVNSSLLMDYTPNRFVIDSLKKGYNTEGRVMMDRNAPWSASKDAFYVIISREGVRKGRTVLRLFSKLVSVTVYIVSTALFACSTLLHLQPAILVMALVLCAAIFGRVIAMWISSVIMQDRPVLHRIVRTNKEANIFVEAVLRKEGIVCEVLGHVVINGRCVKMRGRFEWSAVLGILARPFNVSRISIVSSA